MLIETNCRHKKKPPVLRSRRGKIRSWLRRKRAAVAEFRRMQFDKIPRARNARVSMPKYGGRFRTWISSSRCDPQLM